MAHISGSYCPHAPKRVVKGCPFKIKCTDKILLNMMKNYLPKSITEHKYTECSNPNNKTPTSEPNINWNKTDWEAYHMFNIEYWQNIFLERDCSKLAI